MKRNAILVLCGILLVFAVSCTKEEVTVQDTAKTTAVTAGNEPAQTENPPMIPEDMQIPRGPEIPQGGFAFGPEPPEGSAEFGDFNPGQRDFGNRTGFERGDFGGFGGGPAGGLVTNNSGNAAVFDTSLDPSAFSASVSSPDNPDTYYDALDIPENYVFSDMAIDLNTVGTYEDGDFSVTVTEDEITVKSSSKTENLNIILSGSYTGKVTVNCKAAYKLTLDNVTITGTAGPALSLKGDRVFIAAIGESFISDAATNEKKGALTSEGNLVFTGDGTLTVTAYKKHGVKVDTTVRILSGTLIVITDENAEGNAISVDDAFIMDGGLLKINAAGSVYGSESKGVKVNGAEGENPKGYLVVNGGEIDIVSVGKALTAGWKIDEDAETADTSDDPTPNLTVNGGLVTVTTTGTPYEYSDEESLSPEGLEAKNILTINGGMIQITSTDDAINAGEMVIINGGYILARSTTNDAIDGNGTITINGGTIIALGGPVPETGIDCDMSSRFTYTGGTVVALGGAQNNTPGASGTTGRMVSATLASSAKSAALIDSSKNVIMAFSIPDYYSANQINIMMGTDSLTKSGSYSIKSNIAITAIEYFNGLVL